MEYDNDNVPIHTCIDCGKQEKGYIKDEDIPFLCNDCDITNINIEDFEKKFAKFLSKYLISKEKKFQKIEEDWVDEHDFYNLLEDIEQYIKEKIKKVRQRRK